MQSAQDHSKIVINLPLLVVAVDDSCFCYQYQWHSNCGQHKQFLLTSIRNDRCRTLTTSEQNNVSFTFWIQGSCLMSRCLWSLFSKRYIKQLFRNFDIKESKFQWGTNSEKIKNHDVLHKNVSTRYSSFQASSSSKSKRSTKESKLFIKVWQNRFKKFVHE